MSDAPDRRRWRSRSRRVPLNQSDSAPSEPQKGGVSSGRLSWFQRIVALLGALAALATVVAVIIAQWPTPDPLGERLTPHLKVLQAANQHLTTALNSLGSSSSVKLSRARSATVMVRTNKVAVFTSSAEADGDGEQQLKATVEAVVGAEREYLETVQAFLIRKPTKNQKENFWLMSEGLRDRLDELHAHVDFIAANSVDGANVLSEWYSRKRGDQTAINQFPSAQRKEARQRVLDNSSSDPGVEHQCSNQRDDDGDGKTDYSDVGVGDPDCTSASDEREAADTSGLQCSNESDDDGDGKTDYNPDGTGDPDCSDASDNQEAAVTKPECINGKDDDLDGKIDYNPDGTGDPDCSDASDNQEAAVTKPECINGEDDDLDGLLDDNDPNCKTGTTEAGGS